MSRALIRIRTIADRDTACRWARQAPIGSTVEFKAPRRSLEQNSLLWARLTDLSRQLAWHGQKLSPEDYKDVLMASLRRARVVPGIDGGFVPIGMRTSELTKAEFTELLDLIDAFGAQHGVEFSDHESRDREALEVQPG